MKKKIFKTKDGSPSLIIDELNETYHSRHGALTESLHVYIEKGLNSWIERNKKRQDFSVLDIMNFFKMLNFLNHYEKSSHE